MLMLSLVLVSGMLFSIPAMGDELSYSMFVNDEPWYSESQYPTETIFNLPYLPISMFSKLEGITVSENKNLNNIMISDANGRYVTFDTESFFAYCSDGSQVYVMTYTLFGGELYVPAEFVCEYFGFALERTQDSSVIRISNAESTVPFEDLIAEYTIETDSSSETLDPDTESDSTYFEDRANVYLLFENAPTDNTDAILDILDEYSAKATFFMTREDMSQYPDTVIRIAASGHSIGAYIEEYDAESISEEITQTNSLLRELTRQKTRLIRIGDKDYVSAELGDEIGGVYKGVYYLCSENFDISDYPDMTPSQISGKMIEALSGAENTTVCFSSDAKSISVLEELLFYTGDTKTGKYNMMTVTE